MEIATAAQMRAIDDETIRDIGIPGPVLMESAGMSVVAALKGRFKSLETKQVVVLCGRGNNGGDGFVVSRRLNLMGAPVRTILLGTPDQAKGDAKLNLEILSRLGIPVETAPDAESFKGFSDLIFSSDIIVDAILGTGLSRGVSGYLGDVIEVVNSVPAFVISVDIPSGLSSDTPKILGSVIRASCTVTFGLPKISQILYPAAEYVGDLIVSDIGIPPSVIQSKGITTFRLDADELAPSAFLRNPDTHKGTFGHVLIIGGSTGKTGAVALAAEAAMRAGAGLCSAAIPASLNEILETKLTEAMTIPLSEEAPGAVGPAAIDSVLSAISELNVRAIAIGVGIGVAPETIEFVLKLLPRIAGIPIVLDADGLNAVATRVSGLDDLKSPIILTPHPKEFSRLSGLEVKQILEDRLATSRMFSHDHNAFLVLKGARSIIAAPDGTAFINMTGNSGMASGGTGDVLTGIIAALAAQGLAPLEAAKLGTYVHGLAGDIAAESVGETSLIASDLVRFLPNAIGEITGQTHVEQRS